MIAALVAALFLAAAAAPDAASCVSSVEVGTKAPHNPSAVFWYHVPAGYDAKRKKPWPVLVYFGGRNCKGKDEASGKLGWSDWADENGVFLVCPGFQNDEYWSPETWSGQALFDALAAIKRQYRIDDAKLCYYGYSAGSQAANLFAAWRPARCRAWVSHACGVFHEPKASLRGVPGLVTCGDADSARYVISRAFVEKARLRGMDVVWKSFPNHPHDVPPDSLRLARAFLAHAVSPERGKETFVGDDQDGVYYPAGSAEADFVSPADRVRLQSPAIAQAWGSPAFKTPVPPAPEEAVRLAFAGTEFVCRVPRNYDAASRIVVLFGGRGWAGVKTLREFGLGALADREKVFLLTPSFSKGEYWRPETGTGAKLARAAAEVERRYGLGRRGLVLYGYSAGGQCAALFAQSKELSVAAWGAHGCGVYPVGALAVRAPALVTCGVGDEDRLRISRSFAMRYREAGGELLLKPLPGGHELGDDAREIAREWLMAVLAGGESWIWGEDDTLRVREIDDIDPECRNPLYTRRLSELWQR
ncbi:MAG: hypothetical protein IJ829_00745 [Kiritimatiellae bacterium]|nr:hypothetical protein [Kiritimatiellia bacterium]